MSARRPARPRLLSGLSLSLWLTLALLLGQPLGWLHGLSHVRAEVAQAQGLHATDAEGQADALCLQCLASAPLGAALPATPPVWAAVTTTLAPPAAPAGTRWAAPACAPCARDPPHAAG